MSVIFHSSHCQAFDSVLFYFKDPHQRRFASHTLAKQKRKPLSLTIECEMVPNFHRIHRHPNLTRRQISLPNYPMCSHLTFLLTTFYSQFLCWYFLLRFLHTIADNDQKTRVVSTCFATSGTILQQQTLTHHAQAKAKSRMAGVL